MNVDEQEYLSFFREIMEKYYSALKDLGEVPSIWDGHVDGYVQAGLLLGITSADELDRIIQEENYKVFGISIEERRRKYKKKIKVDENDLDIPTFIREGLLL